MIRGSFVASTALGAVNQYARRALNQVATRIHAAIVAGSAATMLPNQVRQTIADLSGGLGRCPPDYATTSSPAAAPTAPSQSEKELYLGRYQWPLLIASVLSFGCATWSATRFLDDNRALLWMAPYLAFTVIYFLVSLAVNVHVGGFDLGAHEQLVERYADVCSHAGVDILLPTCGEDVSVLQNTWNGVKALCEVHQGPTAVYVLDDAARAEVRDLAIQFGFRYSVRANRGWYKKAGNLRHGYGLSRPLGHEFLAIFDADFRPRTDFLRELLPYFYDDPSVGLVQSPQYFDVNPEQTWLQRGAGAVQEFFYRYSQVARDVHDAAICVGTNAVYRRAALDSTGGTALIEHSEDVHTGFNMRMNAWTLRYVPLILAKGVCPDGMESFFKQQYRWCMGSMSLLGSRKFWRTPMRLRTRLCYFTGFFYYIHTAITLFFAAIVPLTLLLFVPWEVTANNYVPLIPAMAYTLVLFPLWHRADYGSEAWSVKHVYSWAHMFALADLLRRRPMGWSPTGARGGSSGGRYQAFRVAQVVVSLLPNIAWMVVAGARVVEWHELAFVPLLLTGAFATYTTGRVSIYRQRRASAKGRYHIATGAPTLLVPRVVVKATPRIASTEGQAGNDIGIKASAKTALFSSAPVDPDVDTVFLPVLPRNAAKTETALLKTLEAR